MNNPNGLLHILTVCKQKNTALVLTIVILKKSHTLATFVSSACDKNPIRLRLLCLYYIG